MREVLRVIQSEPTDSPNSRPTGDRVDLPEDFLHLINSEPSLGASINDTSQHLIVSMKPDNDSTDSLSSSSSSTTAVYAGIRQFTAPKDCIILSAAIAQRLPPGAQSVKVERAQLPRGSFAAFQLCSPPSELSQTQIPDLRSLLESHLRKNYVTLCRGQRLKIPLLLNRDDSHLLFDVVKLCAGDGGSNEVDAVHLIDTDLSVDIIQTSEPQLSAATLTPMASTSSHGPEGQEEEFSVNSPPSFAELAINGWNRSAQLRPGQMAQYARMQIPQETATLPGSGNLIVELYSAGIDLDIFASTLTSRPDLLDCEWFAVDDEDDASVDDGQRLKRLSIKLGQLCAADRKHPDNALVTAGLLYLTISRVRGEVVLQSPIGYEMRISLKDGDAKPPPLVETLAESAEECNNCFARVPRSALPTHSAFCRRNNWACPRCRKVMKIVDRSKHWHCNQCDHVSLTRQLYYLILFIFEIKAGESVEAKEKHERYWHSLYTCPCSDIQLHLKDMQEHRRSECPARLILCRYCHTINPAGPLSTAAKDRLLAGSPLTQHESECGNRTISCRQCGKSVLIKDVSVHMRLIHRNQSGQSSRRQLGKTLCSNQVCSRWSAVPPNDMQLCPSCYGPFYSGTIDPTGDRRLQRLINKYFLQLRTGCCKSAADCYNPVRLCFHVAAFRKNY